MTSLSPINRGMYARSPRMLILVVVLEEFEQYPSPATVMATVCAMGYDDPSRLMVRTVALNVDEDTLPDHQARMDGIALEAKK